MRRNFLWSKIHRATVTGTDVDYVGSLTLDTTLMEAARLLPHEKIDVYDVDNGERFSTYVIPGEAGSGVCTVNGAAAHKTRTGNRVILAAYVELEPSEAGSHTPTVILVDEANHILKHDQEIEQGIPVT